MVFGDWFCFFCASKEDEVGNKEDDERYNIFCDSDSKDELSPDNSLSSRLRNLFNICKY